MSKRAWHPSLAPVIPVQAIPHLENYKFTPAQQGCFDNFLQKYLWNVIARAMPPFVHPNVVTTVGFLFMTLAFTVSALLIAGCFKRRPACIYFTLAFCIFVYQTCDAVDGILARKLGLSSPLGQFFDHGYDTIYTILWPLFILVAFDVDFDFIFHIELFASFLQLWLVMLKEQEKGVFNSSNVLGVTQIHYITMLGLIMRAIYGPRWASIPLKSIGLGRFIFNTFLAKVVPNNWHIYHLLFFIGVTFNIAILIADIVATFRTFRQKCGPCKSFGSIFIHFLFIYAVHCYKPLGKGGFFGKPALPPKLRLLMYAFTILCFITIAFHNLISIICKMPMALWYPHLAPVYLFLAFYYLKYVVGIAIPKLDILLVDHEKLALVFATLAVYCALYLIHHFICVVLEIKNHLGLTIFFVKTRVASARKF